MTADKTRQRIELGENARVVLERRYLVKDPDGNVIEEPEDLFARVAANIAEAERRYDAASEGEWRERFYRLMTSLRFLPNSPTLGNAGRPLQQLSACFVLPVEDSMLGIFETVKQTALIHQSGGGTGFAFSRLRPAGDIVASTGGVASGPISFMKVFDAATEAIKQGGTRRGANMAILDVHHPDIDAFINLKADMVTLTNFNISVAVDEAFMAAVASDEDYDLVNPRTGEVVERRSARAVFDQIVGNAWQNGDPGLVFLDRINRDHPTPQLGPIEATNPCGEQPLLPFESCNLGSLNLSRFVLDGGEGEGAGDRIDWADLADTIATAVRFLDNVIDMNAYPVPEIDQMTKTTRKIGLGVMGWADLLYRLGVPYDSDEAIALAGRTMGFIREHADRASTELAAERGVFPAWDGSIFGPNGSNQPLRNSTRTTVAPTGTLSIIANCSGGIEPAFSLAFTRQHYLDPKNPSEPVRLNEVNPVFAAVAQERGFYSEELVDFLARGGSLHDRDEVPDDVKRIFVTSHDIAPVWHVQMQAAFQRHTDNAVSKTINFPNAATPGDVREAYMLAYREGCKGITIYRDGSRTGQVLSYVADGEALETEDDEAPGAVFPVPDAASLLDGADPLHRRRLPDERQSITHKFRVGEQEGYVTVGLFEDGTPGEIFVTISKEGSTIRGLMDSVAMLTSYSLQYGVALPTLVDKFRGVHFEPAGFTANPAIPQATSLVDYIFRWLELKFLPEEHGTRNREQGADATTDGLDADEAAISVRPEALEGRTVAEGSQPKASAYRPRTRGRRPHTRGYVPPSPALPFPEVATGLICADCGSQLVFSEGCLVCRSCGFTRCG